MDALQTRWIYAAEPDATEMTLPADDGAGRPVAMEIPPNSAGFLMIHHDNTTNQPITTNVRLNAEGLETPVYTTTETYVAYTGALAIPPQTAGHYQARSCLLPAGARFWRWSMRAHKQAVRMTALDGADVLYQSLDWSRPGASTWPSAPFLTFASPRVTYACTWNNPTTRTIHVGSSQESEEECIAVGYFFPATEPVHCYNGVVLP
jgi:hypothetical protein